MHLMIAKLDKMHDWTSCVHHNCGVVNEEDELKMMTDGGWLETENKEHVEKKKHLEEIEKKT